MADDDFNAGIRIEVENDLFRDEDERMEEDPPSVDDLIEEGENSPDEPEAMQNESDDKEDGELSGQEDNTKVSKEPTFIRKDSSGSLRGLEAEDVPYKARLYPNPHLEDLLVTPERLNSRAARFGTQVSEAPKVYVQEPLPTESDVLSLYMTLGLVDDDGGEPSLDKVGKQYRLDSILIRGTNEMSTNDIFGYLREHNQRPLEMEWVNDACCIVRYKDLYEAARSVLKITKPIHYEAKPEKKEEPEEGEEIEDEDEAMDEVDYDAVDSVSSKYITVAIPPGHTWRFAAPCSQARGILMRYATVNDKKQEKAERHSEYYKKFGNPNYPGHGIVSNSYRRRLQERSKPAAAPAEPLSNQASWAQISDSWNDEEEGITAAPPNRQRPPQQQQSSIPVHERLGRGRGGFSRGDGGPDHRIALGRGQRGKNFRVQVEFDRPPPRSDVRSRLKRRHSPAGSESRRSRDSEDSASDNDEDEDEDQEWSKKLKVPRMRMHADEEEEKMKEKKQRRAPQQVRHRVAERVSWIDARERIPRRRNRDGW